MIWVWLHMLLNGSLFALCWPIRVTCEDVENPAQQPPFLVRAQIPSSLAQDSACFMCIFSYSYARSKEVLCMALKEDNPCFASIIFHGINYK